MTKEDINKYAYTETNLPEGSPCPDRCLYYALRDLYREYRSGLIDKSYAAAQKGHAMRQYEMDRNELDAAGKILQNNAVMWCNIETAAHRYNQDRTIENADAFIDAVYGVRHRQDQSEENAERGEENAEGN